MPAYGGYQSGGGEYGGPPVANSPYVNINQGRFPGRYVEIAPGYGPNDTAPVWVDIATDVTQIQTRRGRQHNLGRFEAGSMTVTVDNKSGRYSPFNASGPYYGLIRPGMPIRFRALWNGVAYPQFTGYVETWPLAWPAASDSMVTITAIDATKFMSLKKPTSINAYGPLIPTDLPRAWWRCNDPVGSTTLADSSGYGNTATLVGLDPSLTYPGLRKFQSSPLLVADTTASLDLGVNETVFSGNLPVTIDASKSFSFECWTLLSSRQDAGGYLVEGQTGASAEFALTVSSTGFTWSGPFSPSVTGGEPSTGASHHVVGTCTGGVGVTPTLTLYVDGVQVAQAQSTSGVGWSGSFNFVRIGGRFGTTYVQAISSGNIQEVAVYDYLLTAAQVLAHYNAGVYPRQLETSGARITYLASYTSIPISAWAIDTGQSTVQGATDDWLKSSVLKSMQDQTDTEDGDLFIDAAGRLTFFNRHHTSRSPYSSVSLILGDGAVPEEPYQLKSLSVPYDDQDMVNEVVVTPAGLAPQIASDTTSQTTYGKRTRSLNVLSSTTAEALGRAQYELNTSKDLLPRIESVTVNPADDPTMLFGPVLGSDLLTRIEVRRRPMDGTSSLFDQAALVEGIEHKVTAAAWETTWRLSSVDAIKVGIFNESNFGEVVFAY